LLCPCGVSSEDFEPFSLIYRLLCQKFRIFHTINKGYLTAEYGYLVSFDVAKLFTNVPVEEVLQIVRNRFFRCHFLGSLITASGRCNGIVGALHENCRFPV
jgi:hypothetical protein